MSEVPVLNAKPRLEAGTRQAMRLRSRGRIPGILYGHKQDPVMLSVDGDELGKFLKGHAHSLLDLRLGEDQETAVIKEVQWDVFGRYILHVDFTRVSKGDRLRMEVPIVLKGTAPGIAQGGVVDQPLHELAIECPAENLQEQIVVNLSGLNLGDSFCVKDLVLPAGVKALADPEVVIIHVGLPRREEAPTEVVAAPIAAEPEVIRREAKPVEEEE